MMDYYGYRYEVDGKGYYHIIPNKEISKPKTFFKYYALNKNSVDALTNMYIYATHPNQFNDPFDCNEKLITFDTWRDVENLWNVKSEDIKKCYPNLEEACRDSAYAYKTVLYRKLGLVSLAPVHDNYQMWALYAQNNGFCVEFDVDLFPFRHFGPFPINYVDKISNPVHIGEVGGAIAMLVQSNVKNKWWENENEWRLYIPNPIGIDMESFGPQAEDYNKYNEHDRKFPYPTSAIRSIFLGTSFLYNKQVSIKDLSCVEKDVFSPNPDCLVTRVLEFLSNMQLLFELHVYFAEMKNFSEYDFIPVVIAKYKKSRYRIVPVSNINR